MLHHLDEDHKFYSHSYSVARGSLQISCQLELTLFIDLTLIQLWNVTYLHQMLTANYDVSLRP